MVKDLVRNFIEPSEVVQTGSLNEWTLESLWSVYENKYSQYSQLVVYLSSSPDLFGVLCAYFSIV